MLQEQIGHLFDTNGYNKIPSNLPEFTFYWRRENQGITVIFVIDYKAGLYISQDQYVHLKEKIIQFFAQKGEKDVHMLSLVLSTDTDKAKKLCTGDSFCWIIDTGMGRLMIHENQTPDFYGLKTILEKFLTVSAGYQDNADVEQAGEARKVFVHRKWNKEKMVGLPWVNICLVAANVIVFLICTFTGDLLYNKGACGVRDIMEDGSYYRILTSMFLHWDVQHLFSNMIVLYYVGELVEEKIGRIPYGVLYFLSGISGGIFSMVYELVSGVYYHSAGASGAVFGVEGALFLLAIMNRGIQGRMTVGRVAFAIMFSLYCGFTSEGINNAAHIGGLLVGFAVMAIVLMLHSHVRTGKDRDINEN